METIMQRIFEENAKKRKESRQLLLFDDQEFMRDQQEELNRKMAQMAENQKISHTYYAHNRKDMDPSRLTASLEEARSVIGGVEDTRDFVIAELQQAGVTVHEDQPLCYSFQLLSLPNNLQHYFRGIVTKQGLVRISFLSPTPKHYMYIGRNHVFVEDLSRNVVNDSVNGGALAACRAMVMETEAVSKLTTTVLMMRVRSVIRDKKDKDKELVGEEMLFIGYRGKIENEDFLSDEEARQLFLEAKASGSIDMISQRSIFSRNVQWTYDEETLRKHTDRQAIERAYHLVHAFTQYRTYLPSDDYQVVEPVLPMDVIAAYVFVPKRPTL